MEDGTLLLVFGDFNIHLEKPYATDFHSFLASFDLKRLTTTSTHKSGNQLDLIYTRDCTADNILVQPLHISDHFFIKLTLHVATRVPQTPLPVTFLGKTYAPFLPPIFPLYYLPLFPHIGLHPKLKKTLIFLFISFPR